MPVTSTLTHHDMRVRSVASLALGGGSLAELATLMSFTSSAGSLLLTVFKLVAEFVLHRAVATGGWRGSGGGHNTASALLPAKPSAGVGNGAGRRVNSGASSLRLLAPARGFSGRLHGNQAHVPHAVGDRGGDSASGGAGRRVRAVESIPRNGVLARHLGITAARSARSNGEHGAGTPAGQHDLREALLGNAAMSGAASTANVVTVEAVGGRQVQAAGAL